jgi:hypothetical protein
MVVNTSEEKDRKMGGRRLHYLLCTSAISEVFCMYMLDKNTNR